MTEYPAPPPPEQPGPPPPTGGPSGPRAGFFRRFFALLLDSSCSASSRGPLSDRRDQNALRRASALGFAYFELPRGRRLRPTIGKRALGIRVIDFNKGGPIGYGRGVHPLLRSDFSRIVCLLGYFWMLWDKEKQCWHDKFAIDVVVPVARLPGEQLAELSASLREYAETPDRFSHVASGASVERFADERICIIQGPTWAAVSGARVGDDEVEGLLAEVRERVPADKEAAWWIGPSARPRDLYERRGGARPPRTT